jgi:hypothetical protein
MALESLTPERVKERLSTGWAMVAGVTYGELPEIYRRPSPNFTKGHRVVVLGWDDDRMRLLDPMQNRDTTFAGQWIRWSEFAPAWWSTEQLWFREGMALPPPELSVQPINPKRRWGVKAGTVVRGHSPQDPREVVRKFKVLKDTGAWFDQVVRAKPREPDETRLGPFVRVVNGALAGLLIDPATPGVVADIGTGQKLAARTALDPIGIARREAALTEYNRVSDAVRSTGQLPPPPA